MSDTISSPEDTESTLKGAVLEKLEKREKERQTGLGKKRLEKEENEDESERANAFLKIFNEQKQTVLQSLNSVSQVEKEKRGEAFDAIEKGIQQLQKFLSTSTMFLPSYHIRQALDVIQNLQQQMQEKEDELIPKKKFGFKANKKSKEIKSSEESLSVVDGRPKTASQGPVKIMPAIGSGDTGFFDRQNEILSLDENDVNHKNVVLSNMTDCTIKVFGFPSTIHMSHMQRCKVMTGPVSTSIFIEGARDCVFVIACQQLRVHSTKQSDFYLHVTSRAIVEDSQQLRFAPYSWTYPSLDEHFVKSGLDKQKNNWQSIDDFNWLALQEKSPNWSFIPESELVKEWDVNL